MNVYLFSIFTVFQKLGFLKHDISFSFYRFFSLQESEDETSKKKKKRKRIKKVCDVCTQYSYRNAYVVFSSSFTLHLHLEQS